MFSILYCEYAGSVNSVILQWRISESNPDLTYKILWRYNQSNDWQEVTADPFDIYDNNGIRTLFDDGDNDSAVPRHVPDESELRL